MQNQEYEIDLMELAIYFCHRWKKNSALRGGGLSHRLCDRSKNGGRELYGNGAVCGKRTVLDGKFFFHLQICKVELCRGCRQPFGRKTDGGFIVG